MTSADRSRVDQRFLANAMASFIQIGAVCSGARSLEGKLSGHHTHPTKPRHEDSATALAALILANAIEFPILQDDRKQFEFLILEGAQAVRAGLHRCLLQNRQRAQEACTLDRQQMPRAPVIVTDVTRKRLRVWLASWRASPRRSDCDRSPSTTGSCWRSRRKSP